MTKQELLKSKISTMFSLMVINTILFTKRAITKEMLERREKRFKKDLYEFIAGLEPAQESQVL
jgi:hypothetical protein